MTTAALAAPARHRAPLRHRFRSAVARLIVWRIEPHLRATDPAELEAAAARRAGVRRVLAQLVPRRT